jgi:hypothetical protein
MDYYLRMVPVIFILLCWAAAAQAFLVIGFSLTVSAWAGIIPGLILWAILVGLVGSSAE